MSAARTNFGPLGFGGLRLSAREFLALGEADGRFELIQGVVVMSPSVRPLHWRVLSEIHQQLLSFQTGGGDCHHYCEIDVQFDERTVYQPDVAVFRGAEPWPIPKSLSRVPDLAIEVLSPGSKPLDLITKRDDYERFGVGEYWVIDADECHARVWQRLDGGDFADPVLETTSVACRVIAGFTLDLAPIRRLVLRP
jgi:Uma2 family endonuclease